MSIWIRAVCTKSIGPLDKLDLRDATRDADLLTWGEDLGLDDDAAEAVEDALRFERETRDVTHMYYRPAEPKVAIRIERWTKTKARGEIDELIERIAKKRGAGAKRVREVLGKAIETIAFELKLSDAQGMGWPIAWQTAMWLAKRGNGLAVTDDPDEWWDPESYEIVLVG